MRTALTRRVFRQLLRNEPLSHSQCLRSKPRRFARQFSQTAPRPLFGFAFGNDEPPLQRQMKPEEVDPGFKEMVELSSLLRQKVRPPPREDVVKAWSDFFESVHRRRESQKVANLSLVTDLQIGHALTTFRYLAETEVEDGPEIELETLRMAQACLATNLTVGPDPDRVELARLIAAEYEARKENADGSSTVIYDSKNLFKILTYCDDPTKAFDFILQKFEQHQEHIPVPTLHYLLRAAALTGETSRVEQVFEYMSANGFSYGLPEQRILVKAFIQANDFQSLKKWYFRPFTQQAQNHEGTNFRKNQQQIAKEVFWECLERGETETASLIIQSNLQDERSVDWLLVLAWAGYSKKPPEQILQMIETMRTRSPERQLTMKDINGVIRAVTLKGDSYLAERYLGLGESLRLKPDAETYKLMVDYRLQQDDVAYAVEAYKGLQKFEYSESKFAVIANKLILTMCRRGSEVQSIMDIVADLIDRRGTFEPQVVAELCMLHLKRDELADAIDLIRTHALQYTTDQRAMIRDTILTFCLADSTSPGPTWDSYVILNELFGSETSRETREEIMLKLFDQGRADMAMHVFGHLRQSPHPERRPSIRSYALCLEGVARSGNEQVFRTIHNMLKLDTEVDPNTHLKNALMLANIATDNASDALKLWEDIIESREGPTYSSIRIAFMAAELDRSGIKYAQDIWAKLQQFDVQITPEMHISYAWVFAARGEIDEAFSLLENLADKTDQAPDTVALATLYNIVINPNNRKLIIEWASSKFPAIWKEVENLPTKRVGDFIEYDIFDIDRGIRA